MTGTTRRLLRATVAVDRTRLQGRDGLRTALGVGVPLLLGVLLDRPLDGVAAAGGAFAAGYAVFSAGYRARVRAVLLATAGYALSTFVGVVVGDHLWLLALTVAGWGFAAGMLVSLGVAAGIIGIQAVIGLLVISQFSMPLADGLGRAGLALLGGLVQVVLVLTVWPLRRAPVERRSMGTVYRSLAAYAAGFGADHLAPPDARPLAAARAALGDPQPFARGDAALVFAVLHDEAEQLRTALASLAHVRSRLAGVPVRAAAVQALDALTAEAAALLRDVAVAVELPRSAARTAALAAVGPDAAPERWARLRDGAAVLHDEARGAGPARGHVGASLLSEVDRRATALLGHLEAVVLLTGSPTSAPPRARPRFGAEAVRTLRANLTLRSAVLRHALRLAGALGAGTAVAGLLPLEHRYWLPLTALVVLKPDFTSTFSRGLGRIAGTVAGAVLATLLAATLEPGPLLLTLLVVLTAWGGYTFLFANYAAYGLFVTGFVVFLLALGGLPGSATVVDRVEATVLGGALALLAYAVWPTWERVRVAEQLARLVEAQARYGAALLEQYADPEARDQDALRARRADARLARTNAEASVDRVLAEPPGRRSGLPAPAASAVVAAARRYALAALALQAHLPEAGGGVPEPLRALAAALRTAQDEVAAALRAGRAPDELPDLARCTQQLQQALTALAATGERAALDAAVLDVETGQLVDAVTAAAEALRDVPVRASRGQASRG